MRRGRRIGACAPLPDPCLGACLPRSRTAPAYKVAMPPSHGCRDRPGLEPRLRSHARRRRLYAATDCFATLAEHARPPSRSPARQRVQPQADRLEALGARQPLRDAWGRTLRAIWIMGGWYGVLAAMLFDDPRFAIGEISSFDIDPAVAAVGATLNGTQQAGFTPVTADMYALDYRGRDRPDLVINTSCEHIADLGPGSASLHPAHLSCSSRTTISPRRRISARSRRSRPSPPRRGLPTLLFAELPEASELHALHAHRPGLSASCSRSTRAVPRAPSRSSP